MASNNELPWNKRVGMLSVSPDAATRDDVACMAAELLEYLDMASYKVPECPWPEFNFPEPAAPVTTGFGAAARFGWNQCRKSMHDGFVVEAVKMARILRDE